MQTRECLIADLRPEFTPLLQAHLPNNENPIVCYEAVYDRNDYPPKCTFYKACIITAYRLIDASVGFEKGFLGGYNGKSHASATSALLQDIVSVNEEKGYERWNVFVNGQGNTRLFMVFDSQVSALKFIDILNRAIDEARKPKIPSQPSPADRLRELQNLYNERLISDAEYQQKRREILGQL
jgi:hypothetical protein